MEIHELDIEISPGGEVIIHVMGARGPACLEYVKMLENMVGKVKSTELTGEYYEPPSAVEIRMEQKTR